LFTVNGCVKNFLNIDITSAREVVRFQSGSTSQPRIEGVALNALAIKGDLAIKSFMVWITTGWRLKTLPLETI
jgi:hypothetical protein